MGERSGEMVVGLPMHLHWLLDDGVVWTIDTRNGQLFAVEGNAAAAWQALAAGRGEHVPRWFLQELHARGILELSKTKHPRIARVVRWAVALFAWLALPTLLACVFRWLVRRALARGGFGEMVSLADEFPFGQRGAFPRQLRSEWLAGYCRAEGLVGFSGGTNDCLPRAFALYLMLCGLGVRARHIIALRPRPFAAHAYVEVDGAPVLEDMQALRDFRPLSVLSSSG